MVIRNNERLSKTFRKQRVYHCRSTSSTNSMFFVYFNPLISALQLPPLLHAVNNDLVSKGSEKESLLGLFFVVFL